MKRCHISLLKRMGEMAGKRISPVSYYFMLSLQLLLFIIILIHSFFNIFLNIGTVLLLLLWSGKK